MSRRGQRGLRDGAAAFRGSWANPDLRRAQLSFAGAWTAEWAFTVALGVVAYQQGGAAAVGLVSLLRMLPAAVVTPFASVYADRWRRERLLVAVSAVRTLTLAATAVLAWGHSPVALVYTLAVVSTLAAVLYRPVHSALLPTLCRTPAELTGANVVRGTLDSLSFLVGPALAAVLLAGSGPAAVFAACALASLWSGLLLLRVAPDPVDERARGGERATVLADLAAGVRAVAADRSLTVLVVLVEVQAAVRGALTVFSVVVAIDLLDMGDAGVGTLNTAVGVGAVVGSLSVSVLVGTNRLARWLGIGVALWGLPFVVIGLVPVQAVAVPVLMLIGVGNALVDAGVFTLIARLAPRTMVARVFGAMEGVAALAVGAGSALTPVVIGLVGLRGALVVVGMVTPVLVGLSWATLRHLDASMQRRDHEVHLLRAVPMLQGLPLPAVEELAIALEPVTVPAGETVFAQGEVGDRCYLVESGSAVVVGDGREVTELGPGDLFGEIALLRQVPRTATVRARTTLELRSLCGDAFVPVVTGFRASAGRASSDVAARLDRFAPGGSHADERQDV